MLCVKTGLAKKSASKETVHGRCKELAPVERAFRKSKSVELEMRPVYVRLADRTRAHAFVVMLAYRTAAELAKRWHDIDLTVGEGLRELATLCAAEMLVGGKSRLNKITETRGSVRKLLDAKVKLPAALPRGGTRVATRKKMPENRK